MNLVLAARENLTVLAVEEMNPVPVVQVSLPASAVSKRNKGIDAGFPF